jgi:putative tryptophan/tyrosine transport system substrate-binding protein
MAVTWPLSARAQQSAQPVVGYLGLTSPKGEAEMIGSLQKGLREAGFEEGRNVKIDFLFADGNVSQLSALAAELVRRNVSVIVAGTTAGAVAAKRTTSTVPVVFVIGADPIKSGLVAQLNRPGANLTGVSFFTNQMESKRLGLLHELAPKVEVIGVLLNAKNPFFDNQLKDLNDASRALGVKIQVELALRGSHSCLIHRRRPTPGTIWIRSDPLHRRLRLGRWKSQSRTQPGLKLPSRCLDEKPAAD